MPAKTAKLAASRVKEKETTTALAAVSARDDLVLVVIGASRKTSQSGEQAKPFWRFDVANGVARGQCRGAIVALRPGPMEEPMNRMVLVALTLTGLALSAAPALAQ